MPLQLEVLRPYSHTTCIYIYIYIYIYFDTHTHAHTHAHTHTHIQADDAEGEIDLSYNMLGVGETTGMPFIEVMRPFIEVIGCWV